MPNTILRVGPYAHSRIRMRIHIHYSSACGWFKSTSRDHTQEQRHHCMQCMQHAMQNKTRHMLFDKTAHRPSHNRSHALNIPRMKIVGDCDKARTHTCVMASMLIVRYHIILRLKEASRCFALLQYIIRPKSQITHKRTVWYCLV